ncbi:MAG: GNAT family N-acetyltransferase [Deltaproteobacteria bacterium]|nr:MAG: GNAT family N-acetyltransferase [Deltaproteobacteria bacterium]
MMRTVVRVLEASDLGEAFELDREAFNQPKEVRERWLAHAEPERFHGVFADGRLVALTQVHAFGQFFGGRSVPMGGVASVATAPDQRGKGLATRALLDALAAMRERGEVISALFPASTQLYRKLGWEVGGLYAFWRMPTAALLRLPPAPEKRVRRVGAEDLPRLKQCYARYARGVNGLLDRSDNLWSWRPNWEADVYAFASLDENGDVDGYVYYHQKNRSDGFGYWIDVRDAIAENEAATRALWRLVGTSATQSEYVRFPGAQQQPLLLLLPDPQREPAGQIHWMLRVVDVAGAIHERGFPPGLTARVELEIADEVCSWNAGRFVLEVADGRGHLAKGGRGTVRLGVGALATLYTGFTSTHALTAVGRIDGAAAELAALDAIFAGPAPFLLDEF